MMIPMNQLAFQTHTLESDKPVLVEFWAPWCVYCRRIVPALNKLSQQHGDTLVLGQVNIDEEPALAAKERIEVVPTLVLYHKGDVLGSIVAPESKSRIDAFLEEALGF